MAINNQIVGGGFTDLSGNPLALGVLVFQLSQDEQSASPNQIGAGKKITVNLDSSGNVPVSPAVYVYANDALNPANSFYTVWAYAANGQLAWGPQQQQVLSSPSPFNLDVWVPNAINTSSTPAPTLTLQTNEVQNGSQSLLDLHAGTNITLTDNGLGRVTIAATGVDLQTNSVDNSSQTKLNFEDTSTVTWASSAGGVVKATASIAPTPGSVVGSSTSAPASTINLSTGGFRDWFVYTFLTVNAPSALGDLTASFHWKKNGGLRMLQSFRSFWQTSWAGLQDTPTVPVTSFSASQTDDGSIDTGDGSIGPVWPMTALAKCLALRWTNSIHIFDGWGFSLRAPADKTSHTLDLYLGISAIDCDVIAHLSDGSTSDSTVTISNASAGPLMFFKVTFVYNSAADGQELIINIKARNTAASGSAISFSAAVLT